jgi:hypothetical protein
MPIAVDWSRYVEKIPRTGAAPQREHLVGNEIVGMKHRPTQPDQGPQRSPRSRAAAGRRAAIVRPLTVEGRTRTLARPSPPTPRNRGQFFNRCHKPLLTQARTCDFSRHPGRSNCLPKYSAAASGDAKYSSKPVSWSQFVPQLTPRNGQLARAGYWQKAIFPGQKWCPRQDSNLRSRLRRAVLYPLSYGGLRGAAP